MKTTWKNGVILGGLLALAAMVGLKMKKRCEENGGCEEALKPIVKQLKKQYREAKEMTQDQYNTVVETLVDAYAKEKEMMLDAKETLLKTLQGMWKEIKANHDER